MAKIRARMWQLLVGRAFTPLACEKDALPNPFDTRRAGAQTWRRRNFDTKCVSPSIVFSLTPEVPLVPLVLVLLARWYLSRPWRKPRNGARVAEKFQTQSLWSGRWYWIDLLICTSTSFGTENFKNLVLTFLYSARVPGTALIGRSDRTYNVQEGEALAREDSRET